MSFAEQVYEQLKKVPKGKVTTYKALAESLGTKAYRAVGSALKNNPYSPEVPCHRVVRSNGCVGGFKGKMVGHEIDEKMSLLKSEGIKIVNEKIDLKTYAYRQ